MTTQFISVETDAHKCDLPEANYFPEGSLQHCEVCGRYFRNKWVDRGRMWVRISDRKARRVVRSVERRRFKSEADFARRTGCTTEEET